MKERLTKRDKDGNAVAFNYIKTAGEFKEIVDRLAEYEDLEEQGLIVRLPCKVGDKFYLIEKYPPDIIEKEVCGFTIENGEIVLIDENDSRYGRYWFNEEIVFTRAEAEKKLKELKGELK